MQSSKIINLQNTLCVITAENTSPVITAMAALSGGANMIQLRHKSAPGKTFLSWAVEIVRLCHQYGARCIINDRIDIALASMADGVHLGQDDIPAEQARRILGKEAIIGISVSSVFEAEQAFNDGADYLGVGHIYPTHSKTKNTPPLGPEMITRIVSDVDLPVIAIGGITLDKVPEIMRARASGVAVISAISNSPEPTAMTRLFKNAILKCLK